MHAGKPVRYRFGSFEANIAESALFENGVRVFIQEKPFQFLAALLQSEGMVVTREELSRRLWPDTHVQVNQGLNAAARKVRIALKDDAANPRFIETLGSRGYRFIHPIELLPTEHSASPVAPQNANSPHNLHEMYLRGRHFWAKRTAPSLHKSLYCFQHVLEHEPNHALAHAGKADAYNMLATIGAMLPRTGFAKAKSEAERAVSLDPMMCEGQVSLGWAQLCLEHDWAEAQRRFDHAIELEPKYSFAHHGRSLLLMSLGDVKGSIAAMQRARDLEPLSLSANSILALRYYYGREYAKAADAGESALELDPQFPLAHIVAGLSKLAMNEFAEALEHFENSVRYSGEAPVSVAHLAHALAVAGHTERARETLLELSERKEGQIPPAYHIALAHLALGEEGEALKWLERACEERSHLTLMMRYDPRLDELSRKPSFRTLCESFNLPRHD